MSAHHVAMQQDKQNQQRRASYAYVTPETHTLTRRNSITHQQVQKVQPMIQTQVQQQQPQIQKQPQQPPPQQHQPQQQPQQQQFQPLVKPQPPIFLQPSHPPPSCPITPPNIQPLDMQDDTKSSSDESCSTCESESEKDDKEEQEIFIDFKPRVSPVPSPSAVKKKKLQKTLSEGEILLDRKKTKPSDQAPTSAISASEEDLKSPVVDPHKDANLQFSETPIKDEGIFIGGPGPGDADRRKESFRKRSVSLDDPTSMEEEKGLLEELEADSKDDRMATAPPSPSRDERLSIKSHSPFHSSESLATRDNSDGIWNESQATIMTPRWEVYFAFYSILLLGRQVFAFFYDNANWIVCLLQFDWEWEADAYIEAEKSIVTAPAAQFDGHGRTRYGGYCWSGELFYFFVRIMIVSLHIWRDFVWTSKLIWNM